jgi:hypothetical protein
MTQWEHQPLFSNPLFNAHGRLYGQAHKALSRCPAPEFRRTLRRMQGIRQSRSQGNRVKKLPGDETGEEIVIPAGRLAPAAQ